MAKKLLSLAVAGFASAQLAGTNKPENHPSMSWQSCREGGSCTKKAGKLTLDANWRWTHMNGKNCYDGNKWDTSICTDGKTCASKCAIDGADYSGTYGVTAGGSDLKLKFITKHQYGASVGSRLYLMETDEKYQMFSLLNKEFTFDVDMSNVPCGLNAALYFVSMDADGGKSKYSGNKAGAKYGTGYCDAQCPRDVKFINGEANSAGWTPSKSDKNAGVGDWGSCCLEFDVWEANSVSTALTPHTCKNVTQIRCTGDDCGGTYSATRYAGSCDPDGCDFNAYRMGDKNFYGKGKTVDTSKKMTVVTQFIGKPLKEIKRIYVQDGKVIQHANSKIKGVEGSSLTPAWCKAQKKVFGEKDIFTDFGGFEKTGAGLEKGMVLVMSLWNDHHADMQWLDGTMKGSDGKTTGPGTERGNCPAEGGKPEVVEAKHPDATVTFSNIKFGDIGSTFKGS